MMMDGNSEKEIGDKLLNEFKTSLKMLLEYINTLDYEQQLIFAEKIATASDDLEEFIGDMDLELGDLGV